MTVPNFLTISPRLGTQIEDVGAEASGRISRAWITCDSLKRRFCRQSPRRRETGQGLCLQGRS